MIEYKLINLYSQEKIKGIVIAPTCFYMPIRITGLGENLRQNDGNYFIENRKKSIFLSKEAMFHLGNLPIIRNHPKEKFLCSENLANNAIIGNMLNAYYKETENEIWGIARIFDKTLLGELNVKYFSTSPAVESFRDILSDTSNEYPLSFNHIAFVEKGHWDIADSKGFDDSDLIYLVQDVKEFQ